MSAAKTFAIFAEPPTSEGFANFANAFRGSTHANRSVLLVLGGALLHPDEAVRKQRASWVAERDAACWPTLPLRVLAAAIGHGGDHDSLVAALVKEAGQTWSAAFDLIGAAIETYADASEPWHSRASDDLVWPRRWRQHARVVHLAGQLERQRWDLAEHRDAAGWA